jgi:hypothetical protein
MDLYLPDEFYALSETPNARRDGADRNDEWLGGEAFVAPGATLAPRGAEPDPIWQVI